MPRYGIPPSLCFSGHFGAAFHRLARSAVRSSGWPAGGTAAPVRVRKRSRACDARLRRSPLYAAHASASTCGCRCGRPLSAGRRDLTRGVWRGGLSLRGQREQLCSSVVPARYSLSLSRVGLSRLGLSRLGHLPLRACALAWCPLGTLSTGPPSAKHSALSVGRSDPSPSGPQCKEGARDRIES
jgi:hypothetical protein